MADRFLTQLQRKRIRQVIHDGHLAFIAEMFGPTAIDHDDYERLRASGKIRDDKLMPQDAALAAHMLGFISGEGQADTLALEDFWRRIHNDPQVITEMQREAVVILRDRISQHVRGLGAKLDTIVGHILVDIDDKLRRHRLTKPQRDVARGGNERAAAEEIQARIRDSIRGLRSEWLRTAHTEMHNAVEEAKAIVIAHRSPDHDPRVFKRPRPDACKFCVLLYLRPDGVTPRVFKLSELLANGTNVGRRAGRPTRSGRSRTEWKAVIGAVHPFCKCELSVLPDGMGFDAEGNLVYVGLKRSMSVEVEVLDKALANHVCEE